MTKLILTSRIQLSKLLTDSYIKSPILSRHKIDDHGDEISMSIFDGLFGESKNKKLVRACASGDYLVAISLLKQGADINTRGDDDLTPLLTAIMSGNDETANMLIDYGADINASVLNGLTPLICAVKMGQLGVVWKLINKGADVDFEWPELGTALIAAVFQNNYDAVKILLESGADVNKKGANDGTALGTAAIAGNYKITELLIEYGADINEFDGYGFSPIMRAAHEGHIGVVKLLLKYGADINSRGVKGYTALLIALSENYYDIAELLIEEGADVKTALFLARAEGHLEDEKFMIETIDKHIKQKEKNNETQIDLNPDVNKIKEDGNQVDFNNPELTNDNRGKRTGFYKGNTVGNISNFGYAVKGGDFIYFTNANDGHKIYKACVHTNEINVVCHDKSAFLNYFDGWLYYQNRSDNRSIYKILTDGSSRVKVNHDISYYINISDEWIYYINCEDMDGDNDDIDNIFKVRLDGSERKKISDVIASEIYINDNWIYYKTLDFDEIFRINIAGNEESLVINGFASSINIIDGWIYYINEDEDRIYKAYDDGSNQKEIDYYDLPDVYEYDLPLSINVVKDWIYYATNDTSANFEYLGIAIRKLRTDGSNKTHIFKVDKEDLPYKSYKDFINVDLNVAGDWIFLTVSGDRETIAYKLKIDGSGFSILHKAETYYKITEHSSCSKDSEDAGNANVTDNQIEQDEYAWSPSTGDVSNIDNKAINISTTKSDNQDQEECPYCAEVIKAKAIKCKHCHSMLD